MPPSRARIHPQRRHLAVAGLLGLVVAVVLATATPATVSLSVTAAFATAAMTFAIPLLRWVPHADAQETAERLEGLDPGRSESEVIVIVAALASLAGIAFMLIHGAAGGHTERVVQALVMTIAVASAWVAIHTVYTFRYARHYLNAQPGCIDFNSDEPPRLSDFAYIAFTLGMTFQVSDTALRTAEVRLIVLQHTLLSYVFGTVIVASTLNLVIGLAQ